MEAKQVVSYLCELLNIKTENYLIVDDMIEELIAISDLKSFVSYVKAKITTESYQYLNGYQKFVKATVDYKIINNGLDETVLETYCQKIITKIRSVSRAVDENLPSGLRFNDFAETATFENFKSNGECAFTDKEQRLLNEVGPCKVWLITFDSNEFLQKLMKAIGRLNQKHLAPPKEKMLSLEDIKNKGVRDESKNI